MKKIIITAMILLTVSCSQEEIINDCGCIENQERYVDRKVWTGGDWYYFKEWQKTGEKSKIEGCYTDKEAEYMIREVGYNERWFVTCDNK
jgi:hypothetical protein